MSCPGVEGAADPVLFRNVFFRVDGVVLCLRTVAGVGMRVLDVAREGFVKDDVA